jgi:hypothetical protein
VAESASSVDLPFSRGSDRGVQSSVSGQTDSSALGFDVLGSLFSSVAMFAWLDVGCAVSAPFVRSGPAIRESVAALDLQGGSF